MATLDYVARERLPELWEQIDNTHFSYLETDDCPEKLDQRKKLEGYITDILYLVPHENKFILQATRDVFSRSALSNSDFSGYRLARGWAALARYAGNLLSQPWRKEYLTIRLYSGYYKHEVEGSGLCGAIAMLSAMGYKAIGTDKSTVDTLILDGPVCPDLVAAVSRDSLIAYVECQLMTQIWEEVSIRGGKCSWIDVFHCRENYIGNVEQAVATVLHMQRGTEDLYCNVKFPRANTLPASKPSVIQKPIHMNVSQFNGGSTHINNHSVHSQHAPIQQIQPNFNGMYLPDHTVKYPTKYQSAQPNNYMIINNGEPGMYCHNSINHIQNPVQQVNVMPHNNYDANHMYMPNNYQMNQCRLAHNYQRNTIADPYVLQPVTYNPINHASTLPLTNGYHCPAISQPAYCPPVTGQLIEIDPPNYPESNLCHNIPTSPPHDRCQFSDQFKNDYQPKDYTTNHHRVTDVMKNITNNLMKRNDDDSIENQENIRRNSAPRSSTSYLNDRPMLTLPRSDTQPSLSKAREDGKGTYESWNYVYQNLESRGLKKNFDERENSFNQSFEREPRTRKVSDVEHKKNHQSNTNLDDSFNYLSLERHTNVESLTKTKVDDLGTKVKHKNDTRTMKNTSKRSVATDDKSYLYNGSHNSVEESNNAHVKVTDRTLLISKEDAKSKREVDKEIFSNRTNTEHKKNGVRNINSDTKRKISDYSTQSIGSNKKDSQCVSNPGNQSTQSYEVTNSVNQSLKSRLVVSLNDTEPSHSHNTVPRDQGKSSKKTSNSQWECGTCTYLNQANRKVCDICGKSRQVGVEAQPLKSGGKECPLCTLVNERESVTCEACGTNLKDSPTYI